LWTPLNGNCDKSQINIGKKTWLQSSCDIFVAGSKVEKKTDDISSLITAQADSPTYWLTRFVILRLLGAIYAVAFLVAINQIIPLIGKNGLLPVSIFLQRVSYALGSDSAGFFRLPSIFWIADSDTALLIIAWIGFILSCVVMAGFANAPILAILWVFYMSFVHVGQDWYGYGWEIQLLETGFLAIFLCPLLDMRPFPKRAPPMPIIVLFRWLIFRIMFGAGMIKIRGDEVWRNGTALYYHFETQPLAGPLSRWFHFLPRIFLKMGVWYNFLAELVAPWFIFWPRLARHIAGSVIVILQIILVLSGNLSFLNWLTIVPALACFDDGFWSKILPASLVRRAEAAIENAEPSKSMTVTAWVITVIIALLSLQPVFNMLSPQQIMNTSFDPIDLVNTYGAFGSVGRERFNVVFEGTMDERPDDSANWKAYPYKGLPVALDKRPPQVAPYQLRLDWQMWFASMSSPNEYPWTLNLISKLLHNDPGALGLFAGNPFPDRPPHWIRAVLYRYSFAKPGNQKGLWWNREKLGDWLPALSVNDPRLIEAVRSGEWIY
jgi:Lipase maturation factor